MVKHFNGEGHTLADVTVMAIDKLYSHYSWLSKTWESRWVRTLGTSDTSGMKLRVDPVNLLCPHSTTRLRDKRKGKILPIYIINVGIKYKYNMYAIIKRGGGV